MARISPSVLALLAANLVPLVGAAFFGWSVFDVFAVYWSENVIVGSFMILRLLTNPQLHPTARLGLSVFFSAHYGLFCFVHSVFVVAIVGESAPSDFFASPGHLLASAAGNAWGLGLIALAASHGVSFVTNYLMRERHGGQPNLFAPYARVVLMHVVLLAGAALSFAIASGGGAVLLTLLVAAKIGADVISHRAEHRQRRVTDRAESSADGPELDPEDDESDYIAIE